MPLFQFVPLRSLWLGLAVWLSQAWFGISPAAAQPAARVSESAVKAAFLYKFSEFVEWPAGTFGRSDEPLVIGVVGDDAVFADLTQLAADRTAQERPLLVRRVREPQGTPGTHVLFIGETRETRLREFIPPPPAPVLVVTQQEGALRLGSSINFSTDGGRVRFSASPAQAQKRGLRLSARLLAVAQSVEGALR